jgi:hypothetical protein
MKRRSWAVLLFSLPLAQAAMGQASIPATNQTTFPLFIKVQLAKSVKLSSLKPGNVTEGNLARDVYSSDRKVFSEGSRVRLTVDHLEKKRRSKSDRWPWLFQLFLPRYETFPSFKQAAISVADGSESELHVSLLSARRRTEVQPAPKKRGKKVEDANVSATIENAGVPSIDRRSHSGGHSASGVVMALEAQESSSGTSARDPEFSVSTNSATLPAGTICRILLLHEISASKSHPGDAIEARLLEPVQLGSHTVLPTGSIFEGSVLRSVSPRMLSRAGSLLIGFTGIRLPNGNHVPVSASLTEVEVNRGSHTKLDAEGRLHGDRPGVAWMLINGGVTAGIAKEVDDGTQLVLEAILSSATDASTAGTARIAGAIVSGIFMLTRHGRDVVLPGYTELNIMLNRAVTVSSPSGAAEKAAVGKVSDRDQPALRGQ